MYRFLNNMIVNRFVVYVTIDWLPDGILLLRSSLQQLYCAISPPALNKKKIQSHWHPPGIFKMNATSSDNCAGGLVLRWAEGAGRPRPARNHVVQWVSSFMHVSHNRNKWISISCYMLNFRIFTNYFSTVDWPKFREWSVCLHVLFCRTAFCEV